MMNYLKKELFTEEPNDYSRNHVISNLLKDEEFQKVKIIPSFRKRSFLTYLSKRDYLVNDFFTGAYESNVLDRRTYHPLTPKAYSYLFKDWFSLHYSKYVFTDTYRHFLYWQESVGETDAEVFVLPVLANNEIYYPQPELYVKEESLKVLFTGTYIPLHGIEKIVDAVKILSEKSLNVSFTFIGNGQTFAATKRKIEDLNLEEKIILKDRMDEISLAKEINSCDVMLGIFGDSTKASVVVPNKVYQGLACKKCVVTMKSLVNDEFFSADEVLQVNNTPQKLAQILEDLFKNRELLETTAQKGYLAYNKLYDKTQKDLIAFLKRIDGQ